MTLLRFICAAWVLPAGFSLIAFYGFFTNYTTDVFSRAGIATQYERSVFRYRVLGRWLVDAVSARFEQLSMAWPAPRALALMDPSGNAAAYWAYAFVHTLGTCVGCTLLLLTLRHRNRRNADLVVVAISMVMALAGFVVTPYDGLFFALQMAALALTVAVAPGSALVPMVVVTVLATLTRETAYFIPAFVFAVHHRRILTGDRAARTLLVATTASFVATYVGLRIALGWGGGTVFYAWQVAANLQWTSMVGTLMLAASLVLLLGPGANRTARLWYAGAAVPYILFVHVFAAPWEWRLWIPVVVPLTTLLAMPESEQAATA